jgi:hypothetical protein
LPEQVLVRVVLHNQLALSRTRGHCFRHRHRTDSTLHTRSQHPCWLSYIATWTFRNLCVRRPLVVTAPSACKSHRKSHCNTHNKLSCSLPPLLQSAQTMSVDLDAKVALTIELLGPITNNRPQLLVRTTHRRRQLSHSQLSAVRLHALEKRECSSLNPRTPLRLLHTPGLVNRCVPSSTSCLHIAR